MKNPRLGKLFVVSAPSGAGKTTLVEAVLEKMPTTCDISRTITYTSRQMRVGEIEGQDYCFLPEPDFQQKIEKGFFIEWSRAYGHYYGSPKSTIDDLQEGKSSILIIDRAGAKQVLNCFSEAVSVWIYAPSLEELRNRLILRGKNTEDQIKKRLEIAKQELREEEEKSFYKYKVLNENFNEAVEELRSIFLKELEI